MRPRDGGLVAHGVWAMRIDESAEWLLRERVGTGGIQNLNLEGGKRTEFQRGAVSKIRCPMYTRPLLGGGACPPKKT